jgi:hypothetical protein
MYPEWLTANLSFPSGNLEQQLTAAKDLVPVGLLADSGQAEELAQCTEFGYNHFSMSTLQFVGVWAEENGRDGELPPEFWVRVAQAAHGMYFPEFVPYCLGKAQGWPRQDPADVMAAFCMMPAVAPVDGELRSLCDNAARHVRDDDPATATMLDNVALGALAEHLRSGAYDRLGPELSPLFSEAFDDLFELVTSDRFPAERTAHAWALIGPNPFQVVLEDGPFIATRAEVWWRAA